MSAPKNAFSAGEAVSVQFQSSASFGNSAFVGVAPADFSTDAGGDAAEGMLKKFDLEQATDGEVSFTAPTEPGEYDVRLYDQGKDGKVVARFKFTVTAPPTN